MDLNTEQNNVDAINEEKKKLELAMDKLNVIAKLSDTKLNNTYFCKANLQHFFPNINPETLTQCCNKDCTNYGCEPMCKDVKHNGRVIKDKQ